MFKHLISNTQGISIPQVMITSALMGGVMMAGIKMNQTSSQGQITTQSKIAMLDVKRVINSTMLDSDSCAKTFSNIKIGNELDKIQTSSGDPVIEVGKTYFGKAKVLSIRTVDDRALSSSMRQINLEVKLESANEEAFSGTRVFSVALNAAAAGPSELITSCMADQSEMLKVSCQSFGGSWDGKCSLPKCAPGEFLEGLSNDGQAICSRPQCASGQIFRGIADGGIAICEFPNSNKVCGDGLILSGYNDQSEPICNYPLAGINCGENGLMTGIDGNGQAICYAGERGPASVPTPSPNPNPIPKKDELVVTPNPNPNPNPNPSGPTEEILQGEYCTQFGASYSFPETITCRNGNTGTFDYANWHGFNGSIREYHSDEDCSGSYFHSESGGGASNAIYARTGSVPQINTFGGSSGFSQPMDLTDSSSCVKWYGRAMKVSTPGTEWTRCYARYKCP